MPRAISVLVRMGNFCIDFAAKRANFSKVSVSVRVMLCQSSAPYRTVGKHTFSVIDERIDGLIQHVLFSIDRTENSHFILLIVLMRYFYSGSYCFMFWR